MKRDSGDRIHVQVGQRIETKLDFPVRGGTLMMSRRIWPRVTASRCSQIAPRCQESLKGVPGSIRCHARRTYS